MKKVIAICSLLVLGACTNLSVEYDYDDRGRVKEVTCYQPKLFGLLGGINSHCKIDTTSTVTTDVLKK